MFQTQKVVVALLIAGLVGVLLYFFSMYPISFGAIHVAPSYTVTVVGEAKTQQQTQVATFTAGVNSIGDDKERAIAEVNEQIQQIIDSLATLDIPKADIKTQNLNVYQSEETYYEEGVQKARQGQWRVNNTLEIKLRDLTKTEALVDLLSQSGANNVYGPQFSTEDTQEAEKELLQEAVTNAREKAEKLAQASNKRLGRIITVQEGSAQSPIMFNRAFEGGGGGSGIEPGTSTVTKSVTVTFSWR